MKSACRFFAAFLDVLISLVRSKQNKLFLRRLFREEIGTITSKSTGSYGPYYFNYN